MILLMSTPLLIINSLLMEHNQIMSRLFINGEGLSDSEN